MATNTCISVHTTSRILEAETTKYFVIGRTLRGGRIISPEMDFNTAQTTYNDYWDVVSYFGGGTITMYQMFATGECDVVCEKVVF